MAVKCHDLIVVLVNELAMGGGKTMKEHRRAPWKPLGAEQDVVGRLFVPLLGCWLAPVEMQWAVAHFWCFQLKYQMGKEGADAKALVLSGCLLSQEGTDVV